MKILYVEDDPFDADLARHCLSQTTPPHDVEIAPSLAKAFERLQPPCEFDLVLLDLSLTDGNGLEVLAHVRRHKLPCAVVILTGAGDLVTAELAAKSGADDFIVKRGDYLDHLPGHLSRVLRDFREESARKPQSLRVLYVEPDSVDVALTTVHLGRFAPHIHLESAADGEEVLDRLPSQDTAVEVCDVLLFANNLPGLSALDTLKLLRSQNGVDIPAVLLVGKGSEDIVSQVMRVGFDGFLSKQPFYLHQLPAALEGAFYRAEVTRQNAVLKRSQQRYQDLVTRISSGVYRFCSLPNGATRFDYVSPRFLEIFGLPQDGSLSQASGAFSMAHQDDLAELMRRIDASQRNLEALEWEGRFVIGGQLRWLHLESTPSRLGDGNLVNDGIVKDITERQRIKMAQVRGEERFRLAMDSVRDAFVVIDPENGAILNWNRAAEITFGYLREEVVGQPLHDTITPLRYREAAQNGLSHFTQTGEGAQIGRTVELMALRRNGEEFPIELSLSAMQLEDKWYATGIVRDITERKQAESALRLRDKALEASANAMVITDRNGTIKWANPAFTLLSGYEAADAIGRNPRELVKSGRQDEAFYRNLWQTILAGEVWQGELTNRREDGSCYTEYQTITPVRDENGAVSHFIAIKQDITERKQMEEALRQHQDQLEAAVAQRTVDLIEARNLAEAATRAKSMFLANMSHEIRTPINAVIGMTNLALNTDLDKRQRDYLSKAQFAAESLLEVINDILDFSKIEAGKYELVRTEFKLDDVLNRVANVVGIRLKGKRIEFLLNIAPDVPQYLVDDPLRLGQVLINLCANAVKFTSYGEIVVSVSRLANPSPDQVTLRFSVRDTGIGMSPEQQAGLFMPFSQVDDSSTRKYGGTGLGLVICKQLVAITGGTIVVESELGKGSEFSFNETFGVWKTASASLAAALAEHAGKRALVVDESNNGRAIMSDMLNTLGFEVTEAEDTSARAIAKLVHADKKRPFALVILNPKMPECAAFDVARKIRQLALQSPPKIVMAMAYGDCEVDLYTSREGFDGYLSKPTTLSSLFDVVISAFGATPVGGSPAPLLDRLAETIEQIRGSRVLVAEDNDLNQQIAYELLSDAGVIVTVADNGREALDLVLETRFDAVLMDVQMPVMDGYEATRLIRRDPQLLSLPIIAMTAHATFQDRELCLRAGMNDFITKPTSRKALLTVLAKWMQHAPSGIAVEEVKAEPPASVSPAEPPVFPQNIAGLSLETGLALYAGNQTFFLKLLKQFLQTRTDTAKEIRVELARNNLENARRMAHTMKSVAGAIGAAELSRSAALLENLIANREEASWEGSLDEFSHRLSEVVQGIGDSLFTLENQLPEPIEGSSERSSAEIWAEMRRLLDVDVGMAMSLRDEIRPRFTTGNNAAEFRRFEECLSVYDLACAKACVDKLMV